MSYVLDIEYDTRFSSVFFIAHNRELIVQKVTKNGYIARFNRVKINKFY